MQIQKRIRNYWMQEAESYSKRIQNQIKSPKKQAWASLIEENRPNGDQLKVLDIGTGPGFFAMLLSGMGHEVTAIDCTERMIEEAEANTAAAGFEVDFHVMDCHQLAFSDNHFDLIICRNLTWTLRDPKDAYAEWYRVLKSQGRLLIFDANWNLRLFDQRLLEKYIEDQEKAKELGIIDPHSEANMKENDQIARELFLSKHLRPQWDTSALLDIGFKKLVIDADITNKVWDEDDKILFRSTPMFMIVAEKD